MRYTTLPNGDTISQLAIGAWGMGGGSWGDAPEQQSIDAIHAALDLGINLIDTAPAYGGGYAEQVVGKALKSTDKTPFIMTKFGLIEQFIPNRVVVKAAMPPMVRHEIEQSLTRLGVEAIDYYLYHRPDLNTPFEDTMNVLLDLQKQGKIKHIGISNFSTDQMKEITKYGKVEVLQQQFSLVDRGEEKALKWATKHDMGVFAYGAMGAGILSGKYRTPQHFAAGDVRDTFYGYFKEPKFSKVMQFMQVLDSVAQAHGNVPVSQVVLNWTVKNPNVTTALVGMRNIANVQENCAALDWDITQEEYDLIDGANKTIINW